MEYLITSRAMKALINKYKGDFSIKRIYIRHDYVKCYELEFDDDNGTIRHVHIRYNHNKDKDWSDVIEF